MTLKSHVLVCGTGSAALITALSGCFPTTTHSVLLSSRLVKERTEPLGAAPRCRLVAAVVFHRHVGRVYYCLASGVFPIDSDDWESSLATAVTIKRVAALRCSNHSTVHCGAAQSASSGQV